MKEQTKKEREIYVIGRPSLEHLSPNERKAFFSTLLMSVIGHFKEDTEKAEKKEQLGLQPYINLTFCLINSRM